VLGSNPTPEKLNNLKIKEVTWTGGKFTHAIVDCEVDDLWAVMLIASNRTSPDKLQVYIGERPPEGEHYEDAVSLWEAFSEIKMNNKVNIDVIKCGWKCNYSAMAGQQRENSVRHVQVDVPSDSR